MRLWWMLPLWQSSGHSVIYSALPAVQSFASLRDAEYRWRSSERAPLTSFVGGRQILQRPDFDHFGEGGPGDTTSIAGRKGCD